MSNTTDADIESLAEAFGALSNPNRLRIFLQLINCCGPAASCCSPVDAIGEGEAGACVGELGEGMDIAPSTVSHHLKELRRAGLIRMDRQGQRVVCCIDPTAMQRLARFLSSPEES